VREAIRQGCRPAARDAAAGGAATRTGASQVGCLLGVFHLFLLWRPAAAFTSSQASSPLSCHFLGRGNKQAAVASRLLVDGLSMIPSFGPCLCRHQFSRCLSATIAGEEEAGNQPDGAAEIGTCSAHGDAAAGGAG
ncbi:unnamed protein product, partial [Phaeothamnion confervicola]